MYLNSPAIVLSKTHLNDNTNIVHLYTQAQGCVSFIVKIPKSSKTQIKSNLFQPLNSISVEWDHKANKNLQHLSNIHILHTYATLMATPHKNIVSTLLAEVLYHATKQDHQGDLYPFIIDSLLWYDKAQLHYENFQLAFLMRLITQLGFQPNTDNPHGYTYFDMQSATYIPTQPNHNYYLRQEDAQYIPIFMDLHYTNMHLLRTTHQQRYRALKIITTYYKLHISDFPALKSIDIVNQLLGN